MSGRDHGRIRELVARYYAGKLKEHGPVPRGVDWSSAESQTVRFAQFERCLPSEYFALYDVGCGYGALCEYLDSRGHRFAYRGHDLSPEMVEAARRRLASRSDAIVSTEPLRDDAAVDVVVASGIFNVRLSESVATWTEYTLHTIRTMARTARRAVAFNMLTTYSDADRMRDDLFYADPGSILDFCKRSIARNVSILHDYDLYEFTVIAKPPWLR